MMIKRGLIVLSALILVMLFGCSGSEEQEEAGVIEQTTDKIAQEAVNRIKTPIDKANLVKELTEGNNRELEESMEQL